MDTKYNCFYAVGTECSGVSKLECIICSENLVIADSFLATFMEMADSHWQEYHSGR